MQKRWKLILLIFLIGLFLFFPLIQKQNTEEFIYSSSIKITDEKGSTPTNPLLLVRNEYYGDNWSDFWTNYDILYLSFLLYENDTYFIYHESPLYWDLELYDDPLYERLLGTPYTVPDGRILHEYLIFSPNRTGLYYLKVYQESVVTNIRLAILEAEQYLLNTSEIVLISDPSHPIHIFQVDVIDGNYSCNFGTLNAFVERGWNYVVLPPSYGTFPQDELFYLPSGSYAIIIESSCIFTLDYYPPPDDDPHQDPTNNSDNNQTDTITGSIFDNITPIFGVGALVGIIVLYKMKKK